MDTDLSLFLHRLCFSDFRPATISGEHTAGRRSEASTCCMTVVLAVSLGAYHMDLLDLLVGARLLGLTV